MKKYKVTIKELGGVYNEYKDKIIDEYNDIYEQEIDDLDLSAVIKAINKF